MNNITLTVLHKVQSKILSPCARVVVIGAMLRHFYRPGVVPIARWFCLCSSFFWCTSHYLSLSLSLSFSLSACQQVLELIALIREQRVGKSDAWIPNEEALADVMRRFRRRATGGLSHDLNRTRLIWLAVASGVVAILAVVSLRAVWNRK